jgi:glycosyltransferase involved in cell wall biosynthesis
MTEPQVSVIIPTYNRIASLKKTLAALELQTWSHDCFEVVVVDDGSTDSTPEIARAQFSFPLRYIRQQNQGSAAARNRGAQESSGSLLIFIDDDILPEPGYIAGLVAEHQRYPRIVGMGTCLPFIQNDDSLFARIFAYTLDASESGPEGSFVPFTECTTNNLSVEREDFFELGMMQDVAGDGPTWWGDVDFGYRAMQAGYQFRRSGKAVCYHDDYSVKNLDIFCKRMRQAARISVLLLKKYPGVFHHLPMLVDKAPISRQDPPALIINKLFHAVTALEPFRWVLRLLVRGFEALIPDPRILRPLYRWLMSSYIYEGFHLGLREYGPVKVQS